jgi:hypothetical protein
MLSIFLGAGFSGPAGLPLASGLFNVQPKVDRITRQNLVERVLAGWNEWKQQTNGGAEQYLAYRPGFPYGNGPEDLSGSGYPSFVHIQRIKISGAVPLFKLHGSISWSLEQGNLIKYFDCRPAIRGDAAIVAPVTNKTIPSFLHSTWQQAGDALAHSEKWLIVGYNLPEYDQAVRQLFKNKSTHRPSIHIFDPNKDIAHRFQTLLPRCCISWHPGLPTGLTHLHGILI